MADNHIPLQGSSANWSAITSNSFLGEPQPGQDQVLIKSGDQTAKVAAGQSVNQIQKKLSTYVYDEDEVRAINQNRNTVINQNETLTIIGDRIINVTNNSNESAMNINESAISINESATMSINLTAGVELTLQGPGGSIKIDATGVTIEGVLVKIN